MYDAELELGGPSPRILITSEHVAKNVKGGNPRSTPSRCICSRHGAGRRRAIGGVAAPSLHPRATAPMVRRSGASHREATQKVGAPRAPR